MRILLALGLVAIAAQDASACGEVVTIPTHGGSTTRYAFLSPKTPPDAALVLLVGGGGWVNLDERGCPRALKGNSLVRMLPLFQAAGFATALVDADSDHAGGDALADFRADKAHAEDLGRVVADVRNRAKAAVWVAGTSRGTISAVNAATRLSGPAAPDGVVITSILSVGEPRARKPLAQQSVFDLPLGEIRAPILLVGHAGDTCGRSPASRMEDVAARVASARKQVVTVTGGPGMAKADGADACEARTPHGFLDQEREVVDGIARFVRGGRF